MPGSHRVSMPVVESIGSTTEYGTIADCRSAWTSGHSFLAFSVSSIVSVGAFQFSSGRGSSDSCTTSSPIRFLEASSTARRSGEASCASASRSTSVDSSSTRIARAGAA